MLKKIYIILFILVFVLCNNIYANDFDDTVKQIKYEINKEWNPPIYYKRHTATVSFKVNKEGNISDINLIKSSKVPQLDSRALETIHNLKKLDELPSYYDADFIEVTVSLTNYIYEDMRNPSLYQKKKNLRDEKLVPVNTKLVKIDKILFDEFFSQGESNYQDNMKDLVLNLNIQKALR